jgi:hypothetical protein
MAYNLQQRLNAFVTGECTPEAFMRELVAFCDTTPDSAWDVLSLIDQYHRRGKLSVSLYRTITHRIERHALFTQGSESIRASSATQMVVADATVANDPAIVADLPQPAPPPQDQASEVRALTDELASARAEAALYLERLRTDEWRHAVRARPARESVASTELRDSRRRSRQIRTLRAASWIALAVALGALPLSLESSRQIVADRIPVATTATPTVPTADPGLISLSSDRYVVYPEQTQATIRVQRTSGGRGDVSFVVSAIGSGARPGRDYIFRKPKLAQLPDGAESLQLSIPILQNPLRRHTELFYVEVRNPGNGAALGPIRRATVFIMPQDREIRSSRKTAALAPRGYE